MSLVKSQKLRKSSVLMKCEWALRELKLSRIPSSAMSFTSKPLSSLEARPFFIDTYIGSGSSGGIFLSVFLIFFIELYNLWYMFHYYHWFINIRPACQGRQFIQRYRSNTWSSQILLSCTRVFKLVVLENYFANDMFVKHITYNTSGTASEMFNLPCQPHIILILRAT